MRIVRQVRRILPSVIAILGLTALTGYFCYQLTRGGRSIVALHKLDATRADLELAARMQADDVEALKHRVALLRRDGLDLDLLDEEARANLKLVDPRDVIIEGDPAKK